jgi:DtxR family Mn-dependent transcriptional regulator
MRTLFLLLVPVFLVVLLFLARRLIRGRLGSVTPLPNRSDRILCEDALKHLYNCETDQTRATVQSLAGQLGISVDRTTQVLAELRGRGLVELKGESFPLTESGKEYGLHLVRAHRLWERYLADRTGVSEVEWHGQAEIREHEISREEADRLWAQLGYPTHDPHGDPLTLAEEGLAQVPGTTLLSLSAGQCGRIVHVEDEPESVYARLVEDGVFPGMEFRVVERTEDSVTILTEGRQKTLGSFEASNVSVEEIEKEEIDFSGTIRMADLEPGQRGEVVILSRATRGLERRRLMDLGILPGTVVEPELRGFGGDPTAYRVRGALIALRKDQSAHIVVRQVEEPAA